MQHVEQETRDTLLSCMDLGGAESKTMALKCALRSMPSKFPSPSLISSDYGLPLTGSSQSGCYKQTVAIYI